MPDFLDSLAQSAKATIRSGYYKTAKDKAKSQVSFREAIQEAKNVPIITEIKAVSPSTGTIRKNVEASEIAISMEKGGAIGLSILTEPKHFKGSLLWLAEVRQTVKLPILMKDIIINPIQLNAASKAGANATLLIAALFERGYCECSVGEMIAIAHSKGLEVLLETHTEEEFRSALMTPADLIGINNRNLATLKVDLAVTERILKKNNAKGKIVVSESGILTVADLRFLLNCGAQAFLIGSAVMRDNDIENKVRELVAVS